jgi:predicted aspartyl protease
MDDMGIFRTTIGIENLAAPGRIAHLSEALVDTGSEFTWAPRRVVESLGIAPQRRQQFMAADGRLIERDIGFAIIHAGGVTAPDFVVFAEPADTTLLGVRSLEGLNLRVDVARKRFIDAGPIITAALFESYPAPTSRLAT